METIRELLISLGLDVDQAKFVEAIGLEKLLEKATEKLVEVMLEIPKLLVDVVKETALFTDELSDASERTGLTTDSLQRLGYVAGLAGMQFSDVEISLGHLARSMVSAKEGNKDAIASFGKLHTRVQNADGSLRSTDEVFADLADGFQKLPKGAERSAAAFDVFGRSGAKMLNVIGSGKGEFKELMAEVEDFGITMDAEAIARGAELNKEFLRLGMIMKALEGQFAGPLIEALGPLVGELLTWVRANRELIGTRIVEVSKALVAVLRFMLNVLSGIGKAALFVVDNFKFFAIIMGGPLLVALGYAIAEFSVLAGAAISAGVSAVIAGVSAAAAWVAAAAPVLLLTALFALLLLAMDDVRGFLEGEDSLIGDLGPKWTKFLDDLFKPRPEEHWLIATFRQLGSLLTNFSAAWDQLVSNWKYALNELWLDLPAPLRRLLSGEGAVSGGAASASTAASSSVSSISHAGGDVNASVVINPPAGASQEAIADAVVDKMEEFHGRKNREALASVGGN